MAKRTGAIQVDPTGAGAPADLAAPRRGVSSMDVLVVCAMAITSVAVGLALRLQAGFTPMVSSGFAAALFVLVAFMHQQKMRIDRLQGAGIKAPAQRREPELPALDEAALEVAKNQLEATAAAMREGEPIAPRSADRAAARRARLQPPKTPPAEPELSQDPIVEHGWGEPDAVDALVRQYARELDRAPAAAPAAAASASPRPNLPASALSNAPVEQAAADGGLAKAIRAGADGDVSIHLQPIVAFADRKARLYEVFPRLAGEGGKMLALADYQGAAETLGLALAVERSAIVRCCAIQRQLSERGRARAMIIRLSSTALRDRAFLQRLIADVRPDPLLADLIVFEVDQQEIEQGDGVERDNMEFLGRAGFRFSLGSAETLALELAELVARRIGFVRVTPSVLSAEHNPAAVSELRAGGVETILTAISREEDVRIGRAFGLVMGQGPLFSEPRPLRADVAPPAAPAAGSKKPGRTRAA